MESDSWEGTPIEIIENHLYWISDERSPNSKTSSFFFNIDGDLVYESFHKDFGPLNLANVHRFWTELQNVLTNKDFSKSKIYHHTSLNKEKQANAAFLMGAYMIIVLGYTSDEAWEKFAIYHSWFKPFRDATQGISTYKLTIKDCLDGLYFGVKLGWYNYNTFDLKKYEYYEKLDHGDMNWIVPGKFLGFSSPSEDEYDEEGYRTFTPDDYSDIFQNAGIGTIIRLNKRCYNEQRFIKQGFRFEDIYFVDGTCPSDKVVRKFLKAAETEEKAIAIHCKAGLGRTGTLIGLYCMKHYGFPARAFIGWVRIWRPGSVLGPQQHYLSEKEQEMFEEGEIDQHFITNGIDKMSLEEEEKVARPPDEE